MDSKYKLSISDTAKIDIDNTIDYIANSLKNLQAATKQIIVIRFLYSKMNIESILNY